MRMTYCPEYPRPAVVVLDIAHDGMIDIYLVHSSSAIIPSTMFCVGSVRRVCERSANREPFHFFFFKLDPGLSLVK